MDPNINKINFKLRKKKRVYVCGLEWGVKVNKE